MKKKLQQCSDDPSKTWSLAKKFMDWSSPGSPTQLEIFRNGKLSLCTKAADIACIMNRFFIDKIQQIKSSLRYAPANLEVCKKIMKDRQLSLSMNFVSVERVKSILKKLKTSFYGSIR